MREHDLAYAAGVIDSDGTIVIARRANRAGSSLSWAVKLHVGQVEPEAVELLLELFGGSIQPRRFKPTAAMERGRPVHVWSVGARLAGAALEELIPYLRIKRRQAELALRMRELQEHRTHSPGRPRDEAITAEMAKLAVLCSAANHGHKPEAA